MATEWCVSMASPLTDFTEIAYEGHTHTDACNTVSSHCVHAWSTSMYSLTVLAK